MDSVTGKRRECRKEGRWELRREKKEGRDKKHEMWEGGAGAQQLRVGYAAHYITLLNA